MVPSSGACCVRVCHTRAPEKGAAAGRERASDPRAVAGRLRQVLG